MYPYEYDYIYIIRALQQTISHDPKPNPNSKPQTINPKPLTRTQASRGKFSCDGIELVRDAGHTPDGFLFCIFLTVCKDENVSVDEVNMYSR
jgi:hypothetical protein